MKRYCTFEVGDLNYEGVMTPDGVAPEMREEFRKIHLEDQVELTLSAMIRRNWKVIAANIQPAAKPLYIFILERDRTHDFR